MHALDRAEAAGGDRSSRRSMFGRRTRAAGPPGRPRRPASLRPGPSGVVRAASSRSTRIAVARGPSVSHAGTRATTRCRPLARPGTSARRQPAPSASRAWQIPRCRKPLEPLAARFVRSSAETAVAPSPKPERARSWLAGHEARQEGEVIGKHLGAEIGNAEEQVELGARVHHPQDQVGPQRDLVGLALGQGHERDPPQKRRQLVIKARAKRLDEAGRRARTRRAGRLVRAGDEACVEAEQLPAPDQEAAGEGDVGRRAVVSPVVEATSHSASARSRSRRPWRARTSAGPGCPATGSALSSPTRARRSRGTVLRTGTSRSQPSAGRAAAPRKGHAHLHGNGRSLTAPEARNNWAKAPSFVGPNASSATRRPVVASSREMRPSLKAVRTNGVVSSKPSAGDRARALAASGA